MTINNGLKKEMFHLGFYLRIINSCFTSIKVAESVNTTMQKTTKLEYFLSAFGKLNNVYFQIENNKLHFCMEWSKIAGIFIFKI